MIVSFRDEEAKILFETGRSRRYSSIATVALRKLDQLESATVLGDLRSPPGNRLETLKGDRRGQHSTRINGQFRVCFDWKEDGAHGVEITDYH